MRRQFCHRPAWCRFPGFTRRLGNLRAIAAAILAGLGRERRGIAFGRDARKVSAGSEIAEFNTAALGDAAAVLCYNRPHGAAAWSKAQRQIERFSFSKYPGLARNTKAALGAAFSTPRSIFDI
jgi:hypothetical protein